MEFPKKLYVITEEDGEDSYFVAASKPVDIGVDGGKIAVYELVTVKTKKITERLV